MNLDSRVIGDVTILDLMIVVIILVGASIISKAISIYLRRSFQDRMKKDQISIMTKVINIIAVIIALSLVLPILGVNPTGLVVAGGLVAIIIGFASAALISLAHLN